MPNQFSEDESEEGVISNERLDALVEQLFASEEGELRRVVGQFGRPPDITEDASSEMDEEPFSEEPPDEEELRPEEPTACPTATLLCDSVSASKSKCGWFNDDKYWFTKRHHYYDYNSVTFSHGCQSDPGGTTYGSQLNVFTAGTINAVETEIYSDDDDCSSLDVTNNDFPASSFVAQRYPQPNISCGGTHVDEFFPAVLGTSPATYEDEYDTALLKSNTIAALPPFCGIYGCDDSCMESGQGCSCVASYSLSTNEDTFDLTRVKYEIQLSGPLCAGAVVTWFETFTPTGGGSPTNAFKGYTSSGGGETLLGPYLIPDPTSNGTTMVTDIVVDCSGCTP